jgi:hypothetical protein
VLLPVLCLLRRMYSAEVIMSALVAKATSGAGWRRVAAAVGVPEMTVRGWLRCFAARAEAVRVFFTRAGLATGIDLAPAGPAGSVLADVVAAVGLAVTAVRQRFAAGGPPPAGQWPDGPGWGVVAAWQVASAASGGRLLAPGWPPVVGAGDGDTPEVAGNTSRP